MSTLKRERKKRYKKRKKEKKKTMKDIKDDSMDWVFLPKTPVLCSDIRLLTQEERWTPNSVGSPPLVIRIP